MGDIVSLTARRACHGGAVAAVERAPTHPALRWVVGDVWYLAHRRGRSGGAACGMPGGLILAPPGVPLCSSCYPAVAAETAR
jgi:hypothetical protein